MPRYRVADGSVYIAVPLYVVSILPKLRGRAPDVVILAYAQARPDGGGWWTYSNSREVGAAIGYSASSVREAIALLLNVGFFDDHLPPSNNITTGRLRIAADFWVYEDADD